MDKITDIDLIKPNIEIGKPAKPKRRMSFFLKLIIYLVGGLTGLGIIFFSGIIFSSPLENLGGLSLLGQIRHLIANEDKLLKGEKEERINILALGIGGFGHQGAYLADTIILVSLKPSTGEAALLSIPRDLYVPIPGYGWRKINNTYAFGMVEGPEKGAELTKEVISRVFGLPIHYWALLDFKGLEKTIDILGGLNIFIEHSFTDFQYPGPNYTYQTISFEKGWQHLNGKRVLEFVRSRHGTGGESSDFSRARRQQKILLALKDKILSLRILLNPIKIHELSQVLGEHFKTDLEVWEIIRLSQLAGQIETSKIVSRVLDNSPSSPLVTKTTPDGAYILYPKSGHFGELRQIAQNIFSLPETGLVVQEKIPEEGITLSLMNGTWIEGLAAGTGKWLSSLGFKVLEIGNASFRDYEKTVIYDLTKGEKPLSLAFLKKKLEANVAQNIPSFLEEERADFVVILGKN